MQLSVTCSGVVIGSAEFDPPEGLAHAPLITSAGFAMAAYAAWELGEHFVTGQYWSPLFGDFAAAAAGRWTGGRLALQDFAGEELSVNNLAVVFNRRGIHVVADFRPDLARVEAFLKMLGPSGGRSRPAA